jgi:hypothetical protein
VQWIKVGELSLHATAPPWKAVFALMMQSVSVGLLKRWQIRPAPLEYVFPAIVVRVSVGLLE